MDGSLKLRLAHVAQSSPQQLDDWLIACNCQPVETSIAALVLETETEHLALGGYIQQHWVNRRLAHVTKHHHLTYVKTVRTV